MTEPLPTLVALLAPEQAPILGHLLGPGDAAALVSRIAALRALPREARLSALRAALPGATRPPPARVLALARAERPRVAEAIRALARRAPGVSPLLARGIAESLARAADPAAAAETPRARETPILLGRGLARSLEGPCSMDGMPIPLTQVSGGFAALTPAAREAGRRVGEAAAAALGAALGAPAAIEGRALPGLPAPLPGAVRIGLSLDALSAEAVLEVDPSLGAGLVDRLAGGTGEVPPAREATPVERATLELLALLALAGAAREEGAAGLAPRLASAPGRPAAPLSVDLTVSAGAARGACRLLVPEAAVRALAGKPALHAAVAAWPVSGWLCSGFAALPPGAADLLEPGDVVVLDEPPTERAFLFLPGLALRGRDLEGQFHVEDLAVTDQAAALAVTLTVEVARVAVPLGELSRLEPGAALPLHAPRDGRVVLRLGERAVARGQLVEIEGALGVRVDELEAKP